jgi:predicted ATP-dependent endonuclease of OLD family
LIRDSLKSSVKHNFRTEQMKLHRIEIKNFRSIEDVSVDFGSPTATIFVGINESGKSNILQAMHLLSAEKHPSPQDVRIERANDTPIKEAYVKFRFLADPLIADQISDYLVENAIVHSEEEPIVEENGKRLSLRAYTQGRREVIHVVDMTTTSKTLEYAPEPKESKVLDGWSIVKEGTPPEAAIQLQTDERKTSVKAGHIIHRSRLDSSTNSWLEPLTIERLSEIVGSSLLKLSENKLPKSMLWDYKKENILPSEIDIETFAENPNCCTPLKNIFELAGEEEIGKCIRETRAFGIHRFKALLARVSTTATSYIREVWRDHKDVSIKLEPNGPSITISISDSETGFSFEQRSDGFKRFATFLLLVAARVRTNDIKNTLLLLDEPEISLHPSGIRNLRDELFRIAKTNYVVIATHSPFMIDRNDFGHNRVVSKKKEVTRVEDVGDSSRMYEEEVLLSALGTSVFEVVKTYNIILEGWRDKRLFEVFRGSIKNGGGHSELLDYGFCHAQGVKDVKNLAPFFQVCNRNLLIVTDSDAPAIQRKMEHEKERAHGRWITYADIFPKGPKVETAEDFIVKNALIAASKVANETMEVEVLLEEEKIPDVNRVGHAKSIANASLQNADTAKKWLDLWKTAIFEGLIVAQIEDRFEFAARAVVDFMPKPKL